MDLYTSPSVGEFNKSYQAHGALQNNYTLEYVSLLADTYKDCNNEHLTGLRSRGAA